MILYLSGGKCKVNMRLPVLLYSDWRKFRSGAQNRKQSSKEDIEAL